MDYIKSFNREIAELTRLYPEDGTIQLINKYCKETGRDYYLALDRLGFKIGIEFQGIHVSYDDTYELAGWIPAIKFREGNPLNGRSETKELSSHRYASISKCYAYLAKEYVYTLMRVSNLEQHFFGEKLVSK